MNPCLLTYYDDVRRDIVDISRDSARHFATTYGLDIVEENLGEHDKSVYMKKFNLTLRELNKGRPFVVYSDVDIVFNKQLPSNFISEFTKKPLAVTVDNNGPVLGFYIIQNNDHIKNVLQMCIDLGYRHQPPHIEQETFLLLYRNFKSVSELVQPIPLSFIADSTIEYMEGTIGRHFYSRVRHDAAIRMNEYKCKVWG